MTEYRVFYANQLYMDWFVRPPKQSFLSLLGSEIYNGGYLKGRNGFWKPTDWYRCDQTPVLLADVPKELRLLELINP